tara:strand:+ start:1964 stop:2752 length:789 start_codon:yes stop_codon:yes gene_type:complete
MGGSQSIINNSDKNSELPQDINEEQTEDLYEIVEKKTVDELKYNNDLNKNQIVSLESKLKETSDNINDYNFEIARLELIKIDLENSNKVLENNSTMNIKKYNQLKDKFNDLEYNKLDIEEKYLTMSDYKDAYINLFDMYKNIEEKNKKLIAEKNDLTNQNQILNKNMKDLCKFKNKYYNLEESNSLLTTRFNSIKKDNEKLKNKLTQHINSIINIFDNDLFRQKIFKHIESLKIEPFVNYCIIDNITTIFKHEIYAFKYKFD